MSDSPFPIDTPVLGFNDFFYRWSRSVTHDCLPLLQQPASSSSAAAAPASVLSADIQLVLESLKSYYEKLDSFAMNDPKTIPFLLFSSWRDSLEMPILFLGDIDPYLLTSLFRSIIIHRENQHSYDEILKTIEDETEIKISVLVNRMREARMRFAARFSENWVSTYLSQEEGQVQRKTVMETAASVEEMEEFANIFVEANRLRKKVITDIVEATNDHLDLAALFLEALLGIFAGFKDQESLAASPLMNNQQHPPEPVPPHYYAFPVMFPQHPPGPANSLPRPVPPSYDNTVPYMNHQQHPPGPANFVPRPVPPSYYNTVPYMNHQQHPPGPANFVPRPVPPSYYTVPYMNQQQHQPVPAHVFHRAEYAIYVGGLSRGVTASVLGDTFRARYQSVRTATVKIYDDTGACAGFGFVSFSDENEKNRAMEEMNDELCCNERMSIGPADRMPLLTRNHSSFSWD